MPDGSLRAVVCDDDAMSRRVVAALLERTGYDVVADVELALSAIDVARALQPHVVVLDLSLMGMSGLESVPDLKAAAPECRIVVFTAFDPGRDLTGEGVTAVVRKGELEELEAVLRRIADEAGPSTSTG